MEENKFNDPETNKFFGIELNQLCWSLLAVKDRTPEEDELMIHAAHASHYHWLKCGTKVNEQRGEWMISHVYAVLGVAERAVFHARRCISITNAFPDEMKDFDIAYANEAMARAQACLGSREQALSFLERAEKKGKEIANKEDSDIFIGDLESEPWYGINS